jgi:argonaute-like protein implicated in RNA metabolism and viral defense
MEGVLRTRFCVQPFRVHDDYDDDDGEEILLVLQLSKQNY